jgi:hypothetical protein
MDWGRTPGGMRYALCTCGWRAPARRKLTHGMSDARDHVATIKRQCASQGWQWWMVKPLGIVTEEPDPQLAGGGGEDLVDDLKPPADAMVEMDTRRARSEGRAPRPVTGNPVGAPRRQGTGGRA